MRINEKPLIWRRPTGVCSSGYLGNSIKHVHCLGLEFEEWKNALCGYKPGERTQGWAIYDSENPKHCPKCLRKVGPNPKGAKMGLHEESTKLKTGLYYLPYNDEAALKLLRHIRRSRAIDADMLDVRVDRLRVAEFEPLEPESLEPESSSLPNTEAKLKKHIFVKRRIIIEVWEYQGLEND